MKNKSSTIDENYFNIIKGEKLLDYGFGNGSKSIEYAKKGLKVTAVDIDETNIHTYKKILYKEKVEVILIQKEVPLPFPNQYFDKIILNEVLEHVDNPDILLKDLYRVLKKDGYICISVPTSNSEKIYTFLNPLYPSKAGHLRTFTKESLKLLVNRIGFHVIYLSQENFQFALHWIFQSALKINPSQLGTPDRSTKLDMYYWKFWGILHRIQLAEIIIRIGNHIFPKSYYLYAKK